MFFFYVNWWITDPEVDSDTQDTYCFALGMRTLFRCPLYLVVNCSSYLPEEYRLLPFREMTLGMVSVFSAELGSTVDTCGASVWFPGDDFMFVSVFSAELGSTVDT